MIIWKGYGFLVLVIAIAIGAIVSLLFANIGSTEDIRAGVGALISGGVIWVVGSRLNASSKKRVFIDKQTGREVLVKPDHSLFFLKMQYWAFIVAGIGVIILIDILIHGKLTF